MKNNYKCVIFDCDGVLVDSEVIGNQVLVDMANEYGANIDLEYAFKYFKGSFLYSCIQNIEERIGNRLPKDFEKQYRQRSFDAFRNDIKPVDGIEDVLKSLTLPYCVASSGPPEKIKLNLELTGLSGYFENRIFSCYDILKWKPDPAVFLWAANSMGFHPDDCVVIEDSVSGIKAARNGNFDVYGYTAHDSNNELKKSCTKTFREMKQLLKML